MIAWGAMALSILTGGRVDYLPGARRPWHIEAFGRVARGKTLDEVLNRLLHNPGRVINRAALERGELVLNVENLCWALVEFGKACEKSALAIRIAPGGGNPYTFPSQDKVEKGSRLL